jgi:hypothetical protein
MFSADLVGIQRNPMMSGIFSAVFAVNNLVVGKGVAIFSGNAIYGGDASYYYKGKYKLGESNNISMTIDVVHHSEVPNPDFGPLTAFRLSLSGILIEQGFTLSGHIERQTTQIVTLTMKKLDDLIETS